MRLSINEIFFGGRGGYERKVELYAAAGFDAIDFSMFGMRNDLKCDILKSDDYRKIAEYLRKTANNAGLTVNQTHAPFKFNLKDWNDPVVYRDTIYPMLVRSLEVSAILGADICVMHPLHHFTYKGREEEIFNINMDFYRSLIPYCREWNIKVGIENMWQEDPKHRTITHDVCSHKEEFVRYIDTLDSEYMVACLDVGHVGLPTAQEDEVEDFILALGHDRLKALHIHDNNYCTDQHTVPFAGKLNWAKIAEALGKIDYTGDFTYEIYDANVGFICGTPNEFLPTALKYIADIGKYIISDVEQNRVRN